MWRVGLVGYGWIAEHGHAPWYRDAADVQVVAVADVCAARRAAAERDFPGVRVYADAAHLLASEADALDLVDIATPPSEHAAVATLCLAHGLHVLCEKPLATSVAAAQAMVRAAEHHQRALYPCHTYKHAPVIRTVNRWLAEGRIGRVHQVSLQTLRNTHARGTAAWRPDWRRERRWAGGGIAMDHGSHTFYLALDWLGGEPQTVTAKLSTRDGLDTEDTCHCALTTPNGLAVAHLTWTAGVRRVAYTLHGEHGAISVRDDDAELSVLGPLRPDGNGAATCQIERLAVPSAWTDASHASWFGALFSQFVRAIERREWAGSELQQALTCVRIIETAYASQRQGCAELPLIAAGAASCPTGSMPSSW